MRNSIGISKRLDYYALMDINDLLALAIKNNASDLHLSVGLPPMLRIDGDIHRTKMPVLNKTELVEMLFGLMNETQREAFKQKLELDFSLDVEGLSRFRVNIFLQARGIAAAFRVVPNKILSLQELGLGAIFYELCAKKQGLVLLTGPTGSGKSTTLAAMIHEINNQHQQHIITIEDPIEFLHTSNNSLINQREIPTHTQSYEAALRSALREDPNVILIGEMRDLATIRLALTAAETGHLVFATLHTTSAVKTIDRIIDVFPGNEKETIRTMLSESLAAVVSQVLLKRNSGGRVMAHEIMLCNTAIRNLIRENKGAQIYSCMQTSTAEGMITLDVHLKQLVLAKIISDAQALEVAKYKKDFMES